jgi:hypothetical protein
MPSSKAGAKSSFLILSKAGYWNGRVLGLANGFDAGSSDGRHRRKAKHANGGGLAAKARMWEVHSLSPV